MQSLRWRDRWKLLRLDADRRSLVFGLLAFCLNLGFGCGMASANALFVSRVGAEPLFYVYLGASVLTFLLAGAAYLWIEGQSRERLFFLSFEIFAGSIAFAWFLMDRMPETLWPVYTARILSDVFFVLALLQFWLLAGERFSNLEARLRFPLFVAANGLGYMVGGLLLQKFAARVQALNFFLLWAGILAMLPLVLWFLPTGRDAKLEGSPDILEKNPEPPPASAFRLLRVLFLFWLAFTFFIYGVDYLFNNEALQAFPDPNQLAAFMGKVAVFSLLAVLLFQILLTGPLSGVLSMHRSMWILCLTLFLGARLAAWNPSLGAVAFAEGLLIYFLDSKAVSLLQPVGNLFPEGMRGRAKVVIDGFAPSTGDILLILVSLGVLATAGTSRLAYVLAAGTLVFLFYPRLFRNSYLHYLRDCLRSRDAKLALNAVQALGEKGNSPAGPELLHLLETSRDPILKREIILSLGRMRYEPALPKIVEQFSLRQETFQLAVIEALGSFRNYPSLFALYELMNSQDNVSFQVRISATRLMTRILGRRMIPLLQATLTKEDPRIQANAIESLGVLRLPEIIPLVAPYLKSEHPRCRANAAVALSPFRNYREAAGQVIAELFQSENPLTRFAGIYAIGEAGLKEYVLRLKALLGHPDPRHRLRALFALAMLGNPKAMKAFTATLYQEDEGAALESLSRLARFPAPSRWRVFEIVSTLEPADQAKVIARMDQTPFDFSQERALLTNRREIFFLPKR